MNSNSFLNTTQAFNCERSLTQTLQVVWKSLQVYRHRTYPLRKEKKGKNIKERYFKSVNSKEERDYGNKGVEEGEGVLESKKKCEEENVKTSEVKGIMGSRWLQHRW